MNNLKQVRSELGCTQEQLAKTLGVNINTIRIQESKPDAKPIYVNACKYLTLTDSIRSFLRTAEKYDLGPEAIISGVKEQLNNRPEGERVK